MSDFLSSHLRLRMGLDRGPGAQPASVPSSVVVVSIAVAGFLAALIVTEQWTYVAVMALVTLVVFAPVKTALGVFAFLIPFDAISTIGETGTTVNWFAGAAAAIILLGHGVVNRRLEAPSRPTLWLGLLIFWATISTQWALDPEMALRRIPTTLSLFLLFVIAACFRVTQEELRWTCILAVLGGAIAAGTVALQRFGGGLDEVRGSLGETDPNEFAATLMLPISLALAGLLAARGWMQRISLICLLGIMSYGVLLSMSRGVLFAYGVLLLVYVVRCRSHRRLLAAFTILLAPLAAVPQTFYNRLQLALESRGQGRFDIWHAGLVAAKDYIVRGAGLNNFSTVYRDYAGYAPVFRGYDRAPHNVYLEIAVELGALGLLLFIAAVVSQLRATSESRRLHDCSTDFLLVAAEAAFWAMLATGFSLGILWRKSFWFVWMLLTLVLHLRYQQLRDQGLRSQSRGAVSE